MQAGYHITEIMVADIRSLDCGANLERRQETVVQLWDVPAEAGETHMQTEKFLAIYDRVAARLSVAGDAALVFECGDAARPAIRHTATDVAIQDDTVVVQLTPIQASCKPRDRRQASLPAIGTKNRTMTTANGCSDGSTRTGQASGAARTCCA
ncbi:MAG TPA: DUF6428 family protein [Trueperaceae bacterium]